MKEQFEPIPVVKNEEQGRFELNVDGHIAFIDYKETNSNVALVHTEAPSELAGTGAAAALVEKTLVYIEEAGKKVLPYCPYVYAFIKKHPEWKRLVAPHFPGYDQL
ncbi:N-acetyltransferase [Sphingobacterium sp. DK4209]|uniref:N-acetyltransferase n=1 Tax=Sphingobacterium zhuxiongii TaxID=2662364 RepID=A0A5Q0QHI5_9SPHI|nr:MULTISPECIES: GNAT family N-acetyltransferase [unclassified Sphingobacterium]MVZ67160.1 N-acetyltransferase [Sphingobacterium sp. DK4209]QGA26880.1 N-acetyltransferase [Sphingobacterium sp. dk4302]